MSLSSQKFIIFITILVSISCCAAQANNTKNETTNKIPAITDVIQDFTGDVIQDFTGGSCANVSTKDNNCKESYLTQDCCSEESCYNEFTKITYPKQHIITVKNCSTSAHDSWDFCCEFCYKKHPITSYVVGKTYNCLMFSSCSVSYNIEHCTNGIPDKDPRAILTGNNNIEDNSKGGSGTKYAALSVAGVVLVALLGFASHSVISTRKRKFDPKYKRGGQQNVVTDVHEGEHHQVIIGHGQILYQPPKVNGRYIGSTLSVIHEEDDIMSSMPMSELKSLRSFKDRSLSIKSENVFLNGDSPMLEENDDDILEIHDLDSVLDDVTLTEYDVMIQPKRLTMGESPRDNVVVCDVHQESMSSSSDSDKTHTKNFSSGDFSPYGSNEIGSLMAGFEEMMSASMYDVTHTSPVPEMKQRTLSRSSRQHQQYVSMPDMSKAQLQIPEIDELLTPSTTSSLQTHQTYESRVYKGNSRYEESSSSDTNCRREFTEGSMSRVDSLEFDQLV